MSLCNIKGRRLHDVYVSKIESFIDKILNKIRNICSLRFVCYSSISDD
jgi:hypothetical protein